MKLANIFLDLTVTKHIDKLNFNIYRKPTTTHAVVHAKSHHLFSQKIPVFNCFIHSLLSIPINKDDFLDELNTIKYIALANGYNLSLIHIFTRIG